MTSSQPLQVFQLSTLAELASLRLRWNELAAGVPTRSWEWLEGWWRYYGNAANSRRRDDQSVTNPKELYLLVAFAHPDRLVGIAPCYIEHSPHQGRVMRFLGSGEVCTDYSTILCERGYEREVTEALAKTLCDPLHLVDWLTDNSVRHWDRIELESVAKDDVVMQHLFSELADRDNLVHRRRAANCWRIALPNTWEEYLATLSKSHRKQVRRCDRELLSPGRAKVCEVTNEAEFEIAWQHVVELHQRRNDSLDKPGCFSSRRFAAFHEDVARQLLKAGNLRLQCLELDGNVVAAEYHLVGSDAVYAYQGGIEPRALEFEPGRLSMIAGLKQAISEGRKTFDLMRGDENYKPHWRATPFETEDIRIVKRTPSNCVRRRLWAAGDQVKHWFKSGFGTSVSTS